jgi:chemotaxis protein CheC
MSVYNFIDRDILKEIGNIGSGHASVAMSILVNKQTNITHTNTHISTPSTMIGSELSKKNPMDIVHLGIEGDVKGDAFVLLYKDSSREVAKLLRKKRKTSKILGEKDISAINEFGNILVGSYLNALSNLTNLEAIPTVPVIKHAQTKADKKDILDSIQVTPDRQTLTISTNIEIRDKKISTGIMVVFEKKSIERILNRTRLKNVMIVDDSSYMRNKIKKIFGGMSNIKVYSTDNIESAVQLYKDVSPSICFIDLVLRKKSGLELIKKLKRFRKKTLIVVISSLGQKMMNEKAKKHGAHEFLKKPLKKEDVIRLLDLS